MSDDMTKYKAELVPMQETLSDPAFNCRGHIAPIDVVDLARDIAERGLDQPIVLQPYTDPNNPKIKWRIVAGHRRHMAVKVNGSDTIAAFIRHDLDEMQARCLNLRENLHRQELNIKQEAHALQFFLNYKKDGSDRCIFTEEELGRLFGQSRGWIQNRKALLELPEDIQDEAAAGMLNQDHIKMLARIKNKNDLYELVRKIKEKKIRGEKTKLSLSVKRSSDVLKAKERKKPEIEELNDLVYETIGPGLVTRAFAWCAGNISTVAFFASLQEYCEAEGLVFNMPTFINEALLGIKRPAEVIS